MTPVWEATLSIKLPVQSFGNGGTVSLDGCGFEPGLGHSLDFTRNLMQSLTLSQAGSDNK